MDVQATVMQNAQDLRDAVLDLQQWEEDVSKKDEAIRRKEKFEAELPPIRGTGPAPSESKSEEKKRVDPMIVAKDEGNEFFRVGKYEEAIRMYTKGIKMDPNSVTSHVLYGNRAMCYLKQRQWELAEKDSTTAVQMNRTWSKGFYRRALARKELGKLKDARQDFETVLVLDRGNSDAQRELTAVTELLKAQDAAAAKNAPAGADAKPRRKLVIQEVEDEEEEESAPAPASAAADKAAQQKAEQLKAEEEARLRWQREESERHAKAQLEAAERRKKEKAAAEQELKQKQARQSNRVEEIDDEESPKKPVKAPAPAAPAPTTTSASAAAEPAPKPAAKAAAKKDTIVPTRREAPKVAPESLKEPKSFVEMERVHNEIRSDPAALAHYIGSVIPPEKYKSLFGSALYPELLTDIFTVAATLPGDKANKVMKHLMSVRRIDDLVMFLEAHEKALVETVLGNIAKAGAAADEVAKLREFFLQ